MGQVRSGSLIKFFVLTYAVMWTFFFSVVALSISPRTPLGALLLLLGTFAPSLVALGLTARAGGPCWEACSSGGCLCNGTCSPPAMWLSSSSPLHSSIT